MLRAASAGLATPNELAMNFLDRTIAVARLDPAEWSAGDEPSNIARVDLETPR
jgi:hypothetical protein